MCQTFQVFRKSVPHAAAGDNVGVLLRGVKRDLVERGMYLAAPGRLQQSDRFTARLYVLTRAEGGRSKPLTSGYIAMAHVDTWSMAACIRLQSTDPGGQTPQDSDKMAPAAMAMPGDLVDNAEIVLRIPMVLSPGQRFVVRDNQQVVMLSVITG